MANLGYSIFCMMKTLWKELPENEKTPYKVKATQVTFIETMFGEKL
jgi:hypothetical protein